VETPSPIAKPTPGNKLASKVAIWPVIVLAIVASAIGLAMVASETGEPEEEPTA
jgi:hypothetical protein